MDKKQNMKQKVKISEVKNNPNNPRLIKDDKFKKLVKSIKAFPEMLEKRPIVVDEDMVVLGGNMRLKASKEAGLKEVWIDVAEGWTEEQKAEFIIKDNVGFGVWDWDMIANEWDVEQVEEWGLDLPLDFDDGEEIEAEEDNYEVPDEIHTDIVLGDLIEIGEHRLLCGDSTDSDQVAKLMNGEKADMVFTDPPYNIDFQGTLGCTTKDGKIVKMKDGYSTPNSEYDSIKNDKKTEAEFYDFISSIISIIKLNTIGGWYICFSSSTINELLNPLVDLGLKWKSIIIWNKNQSPLGGGHFRKKYEPIVYGYFKNKFYGKEYSEDDVWDFQRTLKNDLHPTMKPIPLCEKAIGYSSRKEDIVLDLFLGSGSTMVASHQLKRKCYGMELDPKYCQVIIDRMLKLDDSLKVKINGKEYVKTEK
jgi:DNA modification methylase